MGRKKPRVIVAGQIPPPIGGQNLMVKFNLDLLSELDELDVSHWEFQFTKSWSQGRQAGLGKVAELVAVVRRLIALRLKGPIDFILYPAGGPHTVPILRDMALLPLAALASKRVSVQFHAAGIAGALDRMWSPAAWICRQVFRCTVSDAVVLTDFGRSDAESIGIKKISVVPNAIEDRCPDGPPQRPAQSTGVTLLSVGHICADKGTPELLRAFAEVRKKSPGLRLRVVGECMPPFSDDQLDALISELGIKDDIDLPGVLRGVELDSAFAEADLFVFPTVALYESFGLVMVEAMMWGLPVVCSNWRANAEVFGSGSGGICFDIEEDLEASLVTALNTAIDSRQEWPAWGEVNRERFLENYRLEILRKNLVSLINE